MIACIKMMINCSEVTTWFGYHAASCSYIVTSEALLGIAMLIKLRGGWISWCVRLEIIIKACCETCMHMQPLALLSKVGTNELSCLIGK